MRFWQRLRYVEGEVVLLVSGLTGVAADGGVVERVQAFACAHVQRAILFGPPQLNAIR